MHTHGSGTKLDSQGDAHPAVAPALDCKNAGVFSPLHLPLRAQWSNRGMSNRTETETLAREFDAVISVQRRFGLSTRRENGATIAGCQSENELEGACRLLNAVLHQKRNAHRLV